MSTAVLTAEPTGTDTAITAQVPSEQKRNGKIVTDAVTLPERDLMAEPPVLRSVNVDPNQLRDNPRNLRSDLGDLEDLKASIAVVGILCPLVVVPVSVDSGGGPVEEFQVIIGHRRKYAAIGLGMPVVPCVVAADEGAALQIVAQLAENGHRAGLTATEEAEAYHQLTLLDWSPEQIGKVRAIPATQVRKTLQLRELPTAAREAADAGTLTLDDAAVMAEFADEPAALGRILKATGAGWEFRHAVAAERSKRDATTAKERVKAELVLAGVRVTGKPKQFGYGGTAVDACQLVDADGQRLDVARVRARPGFAAFVERVGDGARAVVYCTDPNKYGYTRRLPGHGGHTLSEEERAAREQADRARQALQEGLTVAASVRRDFIRQAYGTARAAKRLFVEALRHAVTQAVTQAASLRFHELDGLYAALGGADGDVVAAAKEDRLRRCLVAQWICAHENNLDRAAAGQNWSVDAEAAAFWLDQLVADGYQLCEAETTLRQALTDETSHAEDETEDDGGGCVDDGDVPGEEPVDASPVIGGANDVTDNGPCDDGIAGTGPALGGDTAERDVDLAVAALIESESATTA